MPLLHPSASDLKQAIEEGSLSVHFQPQVHVPTGRLVGVEAFARWPHPAHGMIRPGELVSLVDRAGLHVAFDRSVVSAICAQARRWKAARVDVPVIAANVWMQTLRHPDALRLLEPISELGVDPRRIELECPRGSTADPSLTKTLVNMRALGVRLASEEYVNGVRPIGPLRFDTLKIPFPISRDNAAHEQGIRRVVGEAKRMGMRVVADSVETLGQEHTLVELGVDIVQGYLYGPEVAPSELRTVLTRH